MNTDSKPGKSSEQAARMFLDELAMAWADELRQNARIKNLVTNPAVIGAYAEAKLRELVRAFVSPLRVSTGAVIDENLCATPAKVPQIDIIIWLPTTAQAVYTAGDFALVPRGNVMGIIEVKRSGHEKNWSKILAEESMQRLFPDWVWDLFKNFPGFDKTESCNREFFPARGVELLTEIRQTRTDHDHVLALTVAGDSQTVAGDSQSVTPNVLAIHQLVNFLKLTRLRGAIADRLDERVNVSFFSSGHSIPNSSQ